MKKVYIKMPANVQYELGETGEIKARNIMPTIFNQREATKKKYNVMDSLSNLLWEGREIKKAYYDMLTNEVCLMVSDLDWHQCPKCKLGYEGHPAISREDNKTEICPTCGNREALNDWLAYKMKENEKNENN